MIAEPVTKNYTIPQGVDYPIRLRYVVNGTPVNLTGATVRGSIKKAYGGTTILSFTIANGKAYLDTGTGQFGLNIQAADTSGIEATTYVYDLELVLSNGDVTRALQGTMTFTPEVT